MTIKTLTKHQIKNVYKTFLVKDFPKDEIKKLSILLKAYKKGNYVCFGLFENEVMCAYAFLVKNGRQYLLDYLAVSEKNRNKGYGSVFLKLLKEKLHGAECLLLEVEMPETAENDSIRKTRERRIDFYLRNGLIKTEVTSNVFSVDFCVLEMVFSESHSYKKTVEIYREFYRSILNDKTYNKYIIVNNPV